MPQEPWKRASQLARSVPREVRRAPEPPPRPRRSWAWLGWLIAALVFIAAGTWYYLDREGVGIKLGSLDFLVGVFPHSETKSSRPTAQSGEHASAPKITAEKLDDGFGIGLSVYSDYRALLDKTKDRGIEWKLSAAGNALRLSAPGVIAYVEGTNITAYTLDIPQIYAADNWKWWQKELRRAGLTPELTGADAAGNDPGARWSAYSDKKLRIPGGWANPAYELDFTGGTLKQVRGGIRPGPEDISSPAQH